MSNRVSALAGQSATDGIVQISETGPHGMITLRGDFSSGTFGAAVKKATGFDMPDQCGLSGDLTGGIAWMSPDELLLFCAADKEEDVCAALREGLAGEHALVANVSDARAVFQLRGVNTRDVIAKLAPVDTSAAQMPSAILRRTRFAQVPAAFWIEGDAATIICFRSVAQYMFDLLKTAAQPGSEVNFN